ncbi:MAG: purine-nucleoside phosphorylase [Ignavibacteria bacterium]|nr:purine-nucleoside phosphorylase [Ignavibacteria bacterium]
MSYDFLRLRVSETVRHIQKRTKKRPAVALILGSGLGDFADLLDNAVSIPTSSIPNYPHSTVVGHAGKIVIGSLRHSGRSSPTLVVFKGRVHFYETGDLTPTVLPVHVAHALGARDLIVTNAAGGINRTYSPGDLMLIRDVLSLTFLGDRQFHTSDAILPNAPQLPGGSSRQRVAPVFSPRLVALVRNAASAIGLPMREGVYCWLKGPSYETVAEIEMLHRIGADAVGMSTVPEISAAATLGMDLLGLSLISNLASGISPSKLTHDEVTETANRVKHQFAILLKHVLVRL